MSENAKTITFVVIGLVAVAIGLATRPSTADVDVGSLVGKNLTSKFDDAADAKRLRIVRFDEDTATLREFEVAEQDGLWTIPSKAGYPADAARQMAEAATSLMDRTILSIESPDDGDHERYGVIDPLSPKLEAGQKGVGTRVTMSNAENEPLADLIIGKAVKDAEGQRYVREAGRSIVYVVEIDPSKLSTSFENWIEKDLLKLNSWDLQQVQIKDYSAELIPVMTREGPAFVPQWDPRSEMTLAYNDSEAKWSSIALRKFDPSKGEGEYVDFQLAEDEELNEKALNDLKNALDDLKIVDVVRKPQGLSNDLKAGEDFMKNRDALKDLASRGFTPAKMTENGPLEIIASDGEVIATMKNGTEYVLRFGSLTSAGSAEQTATEGESAEARQKQGEANRYLFAMARFNEEAVKSPELKPLPELSADAEAADSDESGEQKEPGQVEDDSQAAEGGEAADSAKAEAAEAPAAEAAQAEAGDAEEKEQEAPAEEAEKTEAAQAEEGKAPEVEKIIAERKQIEQENQRKLDEYQELLKKGQENVKELNLRFGDWYFVVDDSVFRKIRLSRDEVIKKKEKPAQENTGTDAGAEQTAAPVGGIPGLPQIPGVQVE